MTKLVNFNKDGSMVTLSTKETVCEFLTLKEYISILLNSKEFRHCTTKNSRLDKFFREVQTVSLGYDLWPHAQNDASYDTVVDITLCNEIFFAELSVKFNKSGFEIKFHINENMNRIDVPKLKIIDYAKIVDYFKIVEQGWDIFTWDRNKGMNRSISKYGIHELTIIDFSLRKSLSVNKHKHIEHTKYEFDNYSEILEYSFIPIEAVDWMCKLAEVALRSSTGG